MPGWHRLAAGILGVALGATGGAQSPRTAVDLGAAPAALAMQRVLLLLQRSPQQAADLQQLLLAQQTPGSPLYHHWLTPAEFGRRFGQTPEAQTRVTTWLAQQGFIHIHFSLAGQVVAFDGRADDIARAFATSIHRYQSGPSLYWANRTPALVPPALLDVVAGVVSLSNFPLRAGAPLGRGEGELSQPGSLQPAFTFPDATGQPQHALVPADFGVLFQMQPLWDAGVDGRGASIAVVARSNFSLQDVADFRRLFVARDADNLPAVVVNGADPGQLQNQDQWETTLDAEWAGGLAPGAQVQVVVSASTAATDGVLLSAQYIVEHDLAPVMSLSYAACEAQLGKVENQFWSSLFAQAAAEGISVAVSSGDSGAAGCDENGGGNPAASHGLGVNGLASTPYDTAVGGTQFLDQAPADAAYWSATNRPLTHGSALQPIPATAWNDSCLNPQCDPAAPLSASGGGESSWYAQPLWQRAPGVPQGGGRDLPDVAFAASLHDGYLVCAQASCAAGPQGAFGYFILSGTSAAAPAFAALMAMVDQQAGEAQGLANPVLYNLARQSPSGGGCDAALGAAAAPGCLFADITSGNNSEPCLPGSPGCSPERKGMGVLAGYNAAAGYDRASGLGAVHAANLVHAWTSNHARSPTQTQLGWSPAASQQVRVCVRATAAAPPFTGTAQLLRVDSGGDVRLLATLALAARDAAACGALRLAALPGGDYALMAGYTGDAGFAPSLSAPLPMHRALAPTAASLAAWQTGAHGLIRVQAAPYGTPLQLTLRVRGQPEAAPPSGSVGLQRLGAGAHQQRVARGLPQAALLASWPLDNLGEVAAPDGLHGLTPGNYQLVAAYSGDTNYRPSRSPAYALHISRAATSLALSAEPASAGVLLSAAVTAAGNALPPDGLVEFYAGATALGYGRLTAAAGVSGEVAAVARFTAPSPSGGSAAYAARYLGDGNFLASAPFDLSASPAALSLPVGGSGSLQLLLTPVAGFTGAVALRCSVAPPAAVCGLRPSELTLHGQAAQATLTVALAGQSTAPWAPALGLGLGWALSLGLLPAATRRRPRWRLAALAGWALLACACGGWPPALPTTTPPGDYQIYADATSAQGSSRQVIALVVH